MSYDITLLSTADWDNPFWTNKQHVAAELVRRGHRVLYVESLGLRRPSATSQDAKRVLRRFVRAARAPRQVRPGLWVWSPLLLPMWNRRRVQIANRAVLSIWLASWLRRLGFQPDVLWTYNPMTSRLLHTGRFRRTVYHCVDQISAQPGMPSEAINAAERELVASADLCFVTAQHLLDERIALNPHTYYFSNVADFSHFSQAWQERPALPPDLASIPEPRLGFVGAITNYKLDFDLLRYVATSRPDWSLVLVGKVGEGDPWTRTGWLGDLPNVHLLGPKPYAALPAYLAGFNVALLPNLINEYTRAMFPMKFYEYLAAGCTVVSTALPALRGHGDVAWFASTPDEFIAAIERALGGDVPSLERRLAAARNETYESRTERMLELLERHA